jgi:hypothetical protein
VGKLIEKEGKMREGGGGRRKNGEKKRSGEGSPTPQ